MAVDFTYWVEAWVALSNMNRQDKSKSRASICPLTSSTRKRNAADKLAATVKEGFPPGVAQPALRALAAAGYTRLDQLAKIREEDLAKLHGIGPKAIVLIREALKRRGHSFLA
jgi:hypothetical protein